MTNDALAKCNELLEWLRGDCVKMAPTRYQADRAFEFANALSALLRERENKQFTDQSPAMDTKP